MLPISRWPPGGARLGTYDCVWLAEYACIDTFLVCVREGVRTQRQQDGPKFGKVGLGVVFRNDETSPFPPSLQNKIPMSLAHCH